MSALMLREMVRQGVQVDLYAPTYDWQPLPVEPMPGLRIIEHRSRFQWQRWYSRTRLRSLFSGQAYRTFSSVALSIRLLIEHRRKPYDVVYQLSQTELFLLGRLRRLAPPIVVHPCTHAAGELRWHRAEQAYALRSERRSFHMVMRAWLTLRGRLQPKELARADLVIGLSRRFNELIHQDYAVPRAKLRVVYTPVNLARFRADGPEEPANPRTLLFVSRISARKGLQEIVELSHRLADLAGSVRMLVVGSVTQWSDYSAHLKDLNPDVAEHLGFVSTEELPALMRSATMLLVPSRYEPGSIVTGEALACGLPVVLSDEVGNGEIVAGPHVRVHRAGDADALEAAVRSLLRAVEDDEPGLRASARRNAEREFAPRIQVARLIELLASVSGRAPARERPPAGESARVARVSVCIPTRDRPEELRRALASITESTFPVDEVVVSDDGDDDDAEPVCRAAPVDVVYVRGVGRGVGVNRNRAVAAATGALVAFIDDDGILGPEFLEKAIARMTDAERRHGAGRVVVTGRTRLETGDLLAAYDQTFLGHQAKPHASDEGLRAVALNAVLFPRELFDQIQFDPQLVYGYEEVDLASRAAAAGYVIVDCPEAINDHESPPRRDDDYHDRYVEASRLHVTLRRYALTERAPFRALAFVLIAPLHVLAADVRQLGVAGFRRTGVTLALTARMLWRAR
jgi:glycosyltransferase involved in cell wall biosynthesis/GT2 family glycosyltransferase